MNDRLAYFVFRKKAERNPEDLTDLCAIPLKLRTYSPIANDRTTANGKSLDYDREKRGCP
jgi:hypothetical protein